MSTLFIPPLDQWPRDLLYEYHKRAAIRIVEGQPVELAEAAALAEVWELRGNSLK